MNGTVRILVLLISDTRFRHRSFQHSATTARPHPHPHPPPQTQPRPHPQPVGRAPALVCAPAQHGLQGFCYVWAVLTRELRFWLAHNAHLLKSAEQEAQHASLGWWKATPC
ncbi:hypothetical protein BC629DRAFT_1512638 [Irpex lacteus]|nr:hypothetical protein BC629DRAFT_1512638 [Irpex lacteus]